MKKYQNDLSNIQLLTKEQQRELAIQYQRTGDIKQKNKLIESNLRYAYKLSRKYNNIIDPEECISIANEALCNCIDTWNPDLSTLPSYLTTAVNYAMLSYNQNFNAPIKTNKYMESKDEYIKPTYISTSTSNVEDIPDTSIADSTELWEQLEQMLSPLEYDIIKESYTNDTSGRELGLKHELCQQRISQLKRQSMYKLKRANYLKTFWGYI